MAGNVSSPKATLRRQYESHRRHLGPDVVERWGGEVQQHLATLSLFDTARTVAVYDAQWFEVPLQQCIARLEQRGISCVFPKVAPGHRVLTFHRVQGEQWQRGPLGLREPAAEAPHCLLADIDVFLVPGVAFTLDGARLGRGGGYYDATLALRRPGTALVGVAFSRCIAPELPTEAHDVRMDFLATETGISTITRQPRTPKTQV
jgi:5-formyltetrahydrofolate cyclo-ligase